MQNPSSPHFIYNIHNYTYSILIGLDLLFILYKGLLSATLDMATMHSSRIYKALMP